MLAMKVETDGPNWLNFFARTLATPGTAKFLL